MYVLPKIEQNAYTIVAKKTLKASTHRFSSIFKFHIFMKQTVNVGALPYMLLLMAL